MAKNSVLPFLVLGGGVAWYALLEWLRRRPSLQPRESGSSPGTQYLMLLGALGLLLCVIAAAIVALKVWR